MSEAIQEAVQPQAPGVHVLLDERDLRTTYVNAFRLHAATMEVVLDLGFNMPHPNPQNGQGQLLFKVSDRMILNYDTAKRLAMSVGQLVKRFESQLAQQQGMAAQPRE